MFKSRQIFFSAYLSLFLYSNIGHALAQHTPTHPSVDAPPPSALVPISHNRSYFYISLLYIKPTSDNLKYGTFVAGTQPYYQSWHYLAVDPNYHGAFELGLNYALPDSAYSAGIFWTHLHSSDSAGKQASTNTDLNTVEFVAPPFEMSPPVFGIKSVKSSANFTFDNILLNVSKLVEYGPHVEVRYFGGLGILNLNQTMTTTFGDYAGSPATPYSYATPPDPLFSFKLQNVSKYLGAGPDTGVSVRYQTESGFGILGQVMGLLTVGTIKTQDNFTSTSTRLTALGIGTSHQAVTAPDATQVVFGADGKLGVFYRHPGIHLSNITIEAGYRMATFFNAISTVNPNTLVQPGTVVVTPEFATGTMAIVSTDARSRPFSFNGPFLDLQIDIP